MKKPTKKRTCVRAVAIDDNSLDSYETIYLLDKSGEEWEIRRLKREDTIRFICKKHPNIIDIGKGNRNYFNGIIDVTNCKFREYYILRNQILEHTNEENWKFFYHGLYLDNFQGYTTYVYK